MSDDGSAPAEPPWPRGRPVRRRPGGPGGGGADRRRGLRHRARAQPRLTARSPRPSAWPGGPTPPSPSPTRCPRSGRTADYDWCPAATSRPGASRCPSVYAPPCVPVFAAGAKNGGATSHGVTANGDHGRLLPSLPRATWPRPSRGRRARRPPTWPRPRTTWPCSTRSSSSTGARWSSFPTRHRGRTATRWPPGPTPSGWPSRSTPSPPSTARPRHRRTRTSWRGSTCSAWPAALGHLRPDPAERPVPMGQPANGGHLLFETVDYVITQLNGKATPSTPASPRCIPASARSSWSTRHRAARPGTAELTRELTKQIRRRPRAHGDTGQSYLLDLSKLPTQAATLAEQLEELGCHHRHLRRRPDHAHLPDQACAAIGYFPEWVITAPC